MHDKRLSVALYFEKQRAVFLLEIKITHPAVNGRKTRSQNDFHTLKALLLFRIYGCIGRLLTPVGQKVLRNH